MNHKINKCIFSSCNRTATPSTETFWPHLLCTPCNLIACTYVGVLLTVWGCKRIVYNCSHSWLLQCTNLNSVEKLWSDLLRRTPPLKMFHSGQRDCCIMLFKCASLLSCDKLEWKAAVHFTIKTLEHNVAYISNADDELWMRCLSVNGSNTPSVFAGSHYLLWERTPHTHCICIQ